MSPRNILIATLIVAIVVLVVIVPEAGVRKSVRAIGEAPCAAGPPSEEALAAMARLDRMSHFPLTKNRAGELARVAAVTCTEAFATRCDAYRDTAIEAAQEAQRARWADAPDAPSEAATNWQTHVDREAVRAICDEWSTWRTWLNQEGVDAGAACALCELPPPPPPAPEPAPAAVEVVEEAIEALPPGSLPPEGALVDPVEAVEALPPGNLPPEGAVVEPPADLEGSE